MRMPIITDCIQKLYWKSQRADTSQEIDIKKKEEIDMKVMRIRKEEI